MQTLNKVIIVIFFSFMVGIVSSCKKNDTGGTAEIHVMVFHGTTPMIGTATLYVKFNSKSQPSNPTTNFDLKLTGEPDDNHVHIEALRPGNYYCYVEAFDSLAMKPVHGGVAVAIKWSERSSTKEVELQTTY